MSALENKLEKGGFMEERFRERLRTSGKIENSLSTIAYFREKGYFRIDSDSKTFC